MKDYIINVVSYKRPNNFTCNLLKNTNLNWKVFVYRFDSYLQEYINNYESHVHIIDSFENPNLALKRQYVLDTSIKNNYKYCFMLDDDILYIQDVFNNKEISLEEALITLYNYMINNKDYVVALSACYNKADNNHIIDLYKCICNNSIFNLKLYKTSNVKYNPDSKCEDMEFTLELILKHFLTGRLNNILIKNNLQSGLTDDGLSYRFKNTTRFIEEGSYMSNKFPELKDIFEYDKNHFKMNSTKLKEILYESKIIK